MRENYDFCPRCGALMREGVCQSCGFAPDGQEESYYTPLVTPPPATDWRAVRERAGNAGQNTGNPGGTGGIPPKGPDACGNGMYGGPVPNGMPVSNGMPMSNGMPPGSGVPQEKPAKDNSKGAIAVVCLIAVLAALVLIVVGIMAQRAINDHMDRKRLWEDSWDDYYDYEDSWEDDYDYEDSWEDDYDDEDSGYEDSWDEEEDAGYSEYGDEEYERDSELYGSTPDALYYDYLTDSIDYDVDYSFNYHTSEEAGNELSDDLEYWYSYVTLEGEQIPNLDQINRQLERHAKQFVEEMARKDWTEQCEVISYAYVTYNDDQKVSIVFWDGATDTQSVYDALYPVNIDLVNGRILPNEDMIHVDRQMVKEFRQKSIAQNGIDFWGVDDQTLYELMTDPDSLIVFYTPVGLEVGFNPKKEETAGWVTVTYKDYQNLLKLSG